MKLKHLKFGALCLATSLALLVGCSSSANDTYPVEDGTETEVVGEPILGGVVRTTIQSEPDNLDPHLSSAADTESVMLNVFEGLMGFTEDGEFVPRLATDYTISEDGLTYTFTIRTDVTFHTGDPMTMDDVLYSYNRLAGLDGNAPLSSNFAIVESIEATDDETVIFTLAEPSAAFLGACTEAVLPKDYDGQSAFPIGTGPFKFKAYIPANSIILDRYDGYYDEARMPFIDSIEFNIISDYNSILMSLMAGELDISSVIASHIPSLNGEFNIISHPQNMLQIFAMNLDVEPFDDLKVRQAIQHAINKNLLINGVMDGHGTPLYTSSSPVMGIWYNDLNGNNPYPYDPELAVTLLAEAGYPDGFVTSVKVPGNYQQHVDTAQIIADMLSEVGITLNIELIEWGQWLESVYTNREYATTIVGMAGKLEPHDVFIRYDSNYARNFYNYSNPAYDKLIADATVASDQETRRDLYFEAQQLIVDDAVTVFTMDMHRLLAVRPDLKGYTSYPITFFDASKLYYISSEE